LSGVSVDIRERELLAQSVSLPLVCRDVDRLREEKCFIEPIKLLLNRLRAPFGIRRFTSDPGLTLLPRLQNELEVYYIYLSDLTKILTTHSAHFAPHIPDIAQWTARLEQIRVPRNIVGHMNWLTLTDRRRIDVCHDDVEQLVAQLAANKRVPLLIP
jgi:hypothetical protein